MSPWHWLSPYGRSSHQEEVEPRGRKRGVDLLQSVQVMVGLQVGGGDRRPRALCRGSEEAGC